MTSLNKMLSILDLFSEEKPIWTTEEMANELNFSVPTGYRYVRELSNSGLLARVKGGSYTIGSNIIKLDRLVRITDPIISIGTPIMKNLVEITGCEILLSNIYNEEILIIQTETPNDKTPYYPNSRGKSLPLFQSSTSKVVVANMPKHQIQRLIENYSMKILESNQGQSMEEFKANLSLIRQQGYCISHEEIESGISAISCPVFDNNQIKGSLSILIPTSRFSFFNKDKMIEIVQNSANRISSLISEPLGQQEINEKNHS